MTYILGASGSTEAVVKRSERLADALPKAWLQGGVPAVAKPFAEHLKKVSLTLVGKAGDEVCAVLYGPFVLSRMNEGNAWFIGEAICGGTQWSSGWREFCSIIKIRRVVSARLGQETRQTQVGLQGVGFRVKGRSADGHF